MLGMTAVSLGVLEKEELEAEEELRAKVGGGGRKNSGGAAAAAAAAAAPEPPPSPLLVSWDCSIHPLYPALRVKRK